MQLHSPLDLQHALSSLIRQQRLADNLTQVELAARAGVSLAVLRKFEQSGKISLPSFLKLAYTLRISDRLWDTLNEPPPPITLRSLLRPEPPKRQRASGRRGQK